MTTPWINLPDAPATSLPITLRRETIAEAMESGRAKNSWVLAFVIGTKPCFNKVYGSVMACRKAGIPIFVIDANQHYDANLTYGIKEFGFDQFLAVNLQLRGDLVQKAGELFFKTARLGRWLKENWPDVTVIPVVNGDTILCPIIPPAWMFARGEKSIQNEAGLRSMSPDVFQNLKPDIPLDDFMWQQWQGDWQLMRTEPFPEQWDTFVSAAGCEHHMAPVELNRQHLLREGYPAEHIHLTGGVVVDALQLKLSQKPERSIFETYPQLGHGNWVRLDIHRKENLGEKRFTAIFGALEALVNQGHQITMVMMNATLHAISRWNLHSRYEALRKRPNFLATEIWPAYSNVVEFYSSVHCLAAWTDSGGIQEDMNLLGKPCITCRFNTDRPETVMGNHGNLLVPPISSDFQARMISGILGSPDKLNSLANAKPLYGQDAGGKFASAIKPYAMGNESPHRLSYERLGFGRDDSHFERTF